MFPPAAGELACQQGRGGLFCSQGSSTHPHPHPTPAALPGASLPRCYRELLCVNMMFLEKKRELGPPVRDLPHLKSTLPYLFLRCCPPPLQDCSLRPLQLHCSPVWLCKDCDLPWAVFVAVHGTRVTGHHVSSRIEDSGEQTSCLLSKRQASVQKHLRVIIKSNNSVWKSLPGSGECLSLG